VGGVGQQAADRDHSVDVQLEGQADHLADERSPFHARLDAAHDHEIRSSWNGCGVGGGGRPGDLTDAALSDRDHRSVDLEVVVVLGIDIGEPLGGELFQDVVDQPGRRLCGVVPALEGRQQHRLVQGR
jgi:hypothetical protein